MALFDGNNIKLDVLKKWAYNYRWAEVPEGTIPLTAADPDYPVAPEIRKALRDYVDNGYFSYTPKMGYPEFMEAASRALWERKHEKSARIVSFRLTVRQRDVILSLRHI